MVGHSELADVIGEHARGGIEVEGRRRRQRPAEPGDVDPCLRSDQLAPHGDRYRDRLRLYLGTGDRLDPNGMRPRDGWLEREQRNADVVGEHAAQLDFAAHARKLGVGVVHHHDVGDRVSGVTVPNHRPDLDIRPVATAGDPCHVDQEVICSSDARRTERREGDDHNQEQSSQSPSASHGVSPELTEVGSATPVVAFRSSVISHTAMIGKNLTKTVMRSANRANPPAVIDHSTQVGA